MPAHMLNDALAIDSDIELRGLVRLFQLAARHAGRPGTINIQTSDGPGALMMQGGRVCWVVARSTRRFLADRLSSLCSLPAAGFQKLLSEAQVAAKPFGELLRERDLISDEQLREALLAHSLESLVALAQDGITDVTFVPRPSVGFDPRFTFDLVELLCSAVQRLSLHTGLAGNQSPHTELDGVVVLNTIHGGLPVARFGRAEMPLQQVLELTHRGEKVIAALGDEPVRATFNTDGSIWSVRGDADLFAVSEAYSRLGYSWMVSQELDD